MPDGSVGRARGPVSGTAGDGLGRHSAGAATTAVRVAIFRVPGACTGRLEGAVFTGIIEELGKVAGRDQAVGPDLAAGTARITIDGPQVAGGAVPGSSVAVNGVCLTVTAVGGGQFAADVIGETLARSTLGALAEGAPVNLERPVPAGGRLDGHIVQGHVDGVGTITQRRQARGWDVLRIGIPAGLARYVAEKGSVAVDGVSLTISAVSGAGGQDAGGDGDWFEVSLIPETLARTTLGTVAAGDQVNLEVDVIAKYVERMLAQGGPR